MVILKINYKKKLGKSNKGHIITRHRQKGKKSLYIPIDLNYFNHEICENFYVKLLNSTNNYIYRNTKLILGLCMTGNKKGEVRYIIKPNKRSYNDLVKISSQTDKQFGDINYLYNFNINDKLYNIEFKPFNYSKICMSAECFSILLIKSNSFTKIKLPSNKLKNINNKCYSIYGSSEKVNINLTKKAGASRLLGNRPKVRGSAMNACDHPHGGGEGKTPIGKKSIYSFKGKKVKGVKTVKNKK